MLSSARRDGRHRRVLHLTSEVLDRGALRTLISEWEDLRARCVEDNCLLLTTLRSGASAQCGGPAERALCSGVGPLQARAAASLYGPGSAISVVHRGGRAWRSKYTFRCTPLLAAPTC